MAVGSLESPNHGPPAYVVFAYCLVAFLLGALWGGGGMTFDLTNYSYSTFVKLHGPLSLSRLLFMPRKKTLARGLIYELTLDGKRGGRGGWLRLQVEEITTCCYTWCCKLLTVSEHVAIEATAHEHTSLYNWPFPNSYATWKY